MTTSSRDLLHLVVPAAVSQDPAHWDDAAAVLRELDGRGWLRLDRAARRHGSAGPTSRVSGTSGWLGPSLLEPSGFVAAVTSLHTDGRVRERATRVLGTQAGPLAAAALAVRTFDHVRPVRAAARASVATVRDVDRIEAVLDVLLAGQERDDEGDTVEETCRHLAGRVEPRGLLRASRRRAVRRWAWARAYADGTLTGDDLVDGALHDPDQAVRASCARWLAASTDAHRLADLVAARSVEVRVAAVGALPDAALDDEVVAALLLDRAPRVRELAIPRARRRGLDPVARYRELAEASSVPSRVRAACLAELAVAGDRRDLPTAVAALGDPSPHVRASAARAVAGLTDVRDAVTRLAPLLLDPSARVSSTAARHLARLGAPASCTEPAWASPVPAHRQGAWRVTRAVGGWDRVGADLRAAVDADPHLAASGRAGVTTWLGHGAATTWGTPTPQERDRMAVLLPASGLPDRHVRSVAFHAGLARPTSAQTAAVERPGPRPRPVGRRHWWRRLLS
ncbi:HEAT repeat domain-containing protein [Cellulomonas dongxiuzhuiae]|uniref:HEAT repeat domain-containing protein n=1 Tax=Cellulomonas dongxiuzhuiae TaxID=2819979 RepID=UPI001AB0132E|nr:HEAT repeat domain-containing protein [Cellulomonas dongxiuzhuiae]MBO3087810.1 hypothetical protein [Cellulomonas dongxiuzhuiae]